MQNGPLLDHFTQTTSTYRVSSEIVEAFLRAYYAEMCAADEAAKDVDAASRSAGVDVFAATMAVFAKYWQHPTSFSQYWTPSLSWPSDYAVREGTRFSVKQDMMGNFVVHVVGAGSPYGGDTFYLVCLKGEELGIVNKFF
jgi:hypothetical protein